MSGSKAKLSLISVVAAVLATATGGAACAQAAKSAPEFFASMFTGARQEENFNRLDQFFGFAPVKPSSRPQPWATGKVLALPTTFESEGKTYMTADFLKRTDTAAFLVLKDGKLVHEEYALTGGPRVHWISMSVAKSFISAMIGVAVADRKISSIEDPITKYLPDLAGSGYDGVRIKDILQMSSGARWNEHYGDRDADISRLIMASLSGQLKSFPRTIVRQRPPGTFHHYSSADTLVLGLLLEKVTGEALANYTHEKLWEPLGAEAPAFWSTDKNGTPLSYAGFNATARDYARLGELYRNGGKWNGKQVVPAAWVKASVTPDAPHLMPGKRDSSDAGYGLGYGYQWWVPGGADTQDFSAMGIYGQFIYVNPRAHMVIVKLSATHDFAQPSSQDVHPATMALFRTIAASAAK